MSGVNPDTTLIHFLNSNIDTTTTIYYDDFTITSSIIIVLQGELERVAFVM